MVILRTHIHTVCMCKVSSGEYTDNMSISLFGDIMVPTIE